MHAVQITSRALAEGYDTIIAVGGDGTINEVLNGFYSKNKLINAEARLGCLPSATGGDFARHLGLRSGKADWKLSDVNQGKVLVLDHGAAEFVGSDNQMKTRFFMNETSLGFAAKTVELVNLSSKYFGGKISFLLGVTRCLLSYSNHAMDVTVDGNLWYSGPVFLIAVSNGKYFGGSMKIAPEAESDDGLFDIVLIKSLTRSDVMKHIGKIYSGKHLMLPQVISTRGQNVSVRSLHRVRVEMDGEQTGWLEANFKIVNRGINFLVPKTANGLMD